MIGPAGFMAAPKAQEPENKRLDEKGRCCGRKPIYYRGGAWNSPPGSPMLWCCRCDTVYNPQTGVERPDKRRTDNGS